MVASLETPKNCSSGVHRISRDLWCGQIHDGGLQRGQHDCVAAHWLGTGLGMSRGGRGSIDNLHEGACVVKRENRTIVVSGVCVWVCVLVDAEKSNQGQPDLSGDQ